MGEGLLRQRRNLITTCAFLWILKYGGVTFTKFSLGGFDVEFMNTDALILAIWIAFAYFLYRYYQYFSTEGTEKLQKVFTEALQLKCAPIIESLIKDKYPSASNGAYYSYKLLKERNWIYKGQNLLNINNSTTGSNCLDESPSVVIWPRQLWKGILPAVIDSTFRNSVVTDYLLPFALACFILYYCGADEWNGSFLWILTR